MEKTPIENSDFTNFVKDIKQKSKDNLEREFDMGLFEGDI